MMASILMPHPDPLQLLRDIIDAGSGPRLGLHLPFLLDLLLLRVSRSTDLLLLSFRGTLDPVVLAEVDYVLAH